MKKMKKYLAILIAIAMVSSLTPIALAGNTDTIEVTLTPSGTVDIVVDQETYQPTCGIGASNQTAIDWANLDNNGTVSVSVTIQGENSENWTISATGADHDQFKAEWYDVGLVDWNGFDATPETFDDNIAYDESVDFGLGVVMPTSTSTNDVQHYTVTFTATAL